MGGGRGHQGKIYGDARASAFFRFDLQITAMKARQSIGDWQAKARAFMALVEARIDLAKGAHGGFNLGKRHAHAGVTDADADNTFGADSNVNANAALGGCEFHGVAEKIDEDLLEAKWIGHQIGKIGHDVGFDMHVFFPRLGFQQ